MLAAAIGIHGPGFGRPESIRKDLLRAGASSQL